MNAPVLLDLFCCQGGASRGYTDAGFDEYMHIVGNFSGVERARGVMAMPWANRDGLREAIPPAYSEFIGRQLLAHVQEVAA